MSKEIIKLNILHILNDGFSASMLLLLPFIAKDLSLNLTKVGLLGAPMGILQIILALPAGYIAEKIGGIRLLLISILLYGVGYLISGVANGYILLLFSFSLAGIGFSAFHPVAFALVARMYEKTVRGKAMGNFTAIGDVGRIGISAGVTFLITRIGWRMSALTFGSVSLLIFVVLYSLTSRQATAKRTEEAPKVSVKIMEFLKNKRFVFANLAATFDSFASSSLFIFLPFLLLKRGVNPAILGSMTAAFFIGNFMGRSLLGRFVDKFGHSKVFIFSELLMALFIVLLANSTNFYIIVGASIVLGIFTKGTVPVIQTMVSESVEHHGNFEKAFGLNLIAIGLASTLAPVVLGYFSDKLGIVAAFNISAFFALLAIIPVLAFRNIKH